MVNSDKILYYETIINEISYHFTYIRYKDKLILREISDIAFDTKIKYIPKIAEIYDFQEWVQDNGYLQQTLLQFSPEQDAWIDSEWQMPFYTFLQEDDEIVVKAIVQFLKENNYEL